MKVGGLPDLGYPGLNSRLGRVVIMVLRNCEKVPQSLPVSKAGCHQFHLWTGIPYKVDIEINASPQPMWPAERLAKDAVFGFTPAQFSSASVSRDRLHTWLTAS